MESAASLASGPDGKKRRVSYFYEPKIGGDDRFGGEGNLREPQRVHMAHSLILSYNLHRHMEVIRPNLAGVSDFVKFHSPKYIEVIRSVTSEYVDSARSKTVIDSTSLKRFNLDVWDCPVFDGLFDLCRASAGGSISSAAKLNLHDADIAINWSGGMHRAKKDKACGFGYVNDVVLGIFELLKVFKRVLYIDIGYYHGDAVQEAFEETDRVMTLSFHKFAEFPYQRTGDITEYGVGKGEYYSLNAPLKNGLDDASFTTLFEPVILKAMEVYQPEAVVLQCGADSLTGDTLGKFNLSIKGHASCLRYIRSFNVPLMVLGGEGHTLRNVARCWCYETAVAVGEELDDNLPINEYKESFAPDYTLHIRPYPIENLNTDKDISKIKNTLLTQLSQVIHAPSVQFRDTPSISQVTEAAEEDMETRQKPRILSGSPSYESD